MTAQISLSGARGRGFVTWVDDADEALARSHRWYLSSNGYAVANVRQPSGRRLSLTLQRFLLGTPDGLDTDHLNGNRLDNRRANLRVATRQQNNANVDARSHSTQPMKGIRRREGRWEARVAGRSLGRFDTPEQAAAAYDAAAKETYGPFARPTGGTR